MPRVASLLKLLSSPTLAFGFRVHKLWLLAAVVLFVGCQKAPPEGTITGTVTLNGQPVEGGYALIRMEPVDGAGQPNDAPIVGGKYELKIAPGEKKVQLTWQKGGDQVVDTASQGKSAPPQQMFPEKYNVLTELKYTVTEGKQIKNFDITVP